MAISLVAVGQKWTATIANAIIAAVNAIASNVVTPTSVAGTGVSLSGANVVVSAATTASVNGCFTSTYSWYEVEFDLTTSGAATLAGTLRLSGTDAATAYDNQRSSGVDATNTTAQTLNQTSFRITVTGITGRSSGRIILYQPAVAVQTTGTVFAGASANPGSAGNMSIFTGFWSHRTLTAYDGITFTPSTGNITGTIKVRGIL